MNKIQWHFELLFGIVILLVAWSIRLIVMSLAREIGIPRGAPLSPITFSSGTIKDLYVVALFFSALYEETMFRVYIQSKLQSLLGGTVFMPILISAWMFAVAHGYSPRSTLALIATGSFFGVIYHYTRKVPRLVLAHWMHNLTVLFF